jgi:hypothetical protein
LESSLVTNPNLAPPLDTNRAARSRPLYATWSTSETKSKLKQLSSTELLYTEPRKAIIVQITADTRNALCETPHPHCLAVPSTISLRGHKLGSARLDWGPPRGSATAKGLSYYWTQLKVVTRHRPCSRSPDVLQPLSSAQSTGLLQLLHSLLERSAAAHASVGWHRCQSPDRFRT